MSLTIASLAELSARYRTVRQRSVALCEPLALEDHLPQPMADVSPPKWHLAHTTWFFEAMVLQAQDPGHAPFHPLYAHLFNSYYEGVGPRVPRAERGHLSRPTVAEVHAYRAHVDDAMLALLAHPRAEPWMARIELGLQHEQQHQELLLTDIKFILGSNPLRPAYVPSHLPSHLPGHLPGPASGRASRPGALAIEPACEHEPEPHASGDLWLDHAGGLCEIGHDARAAGFAFDNEGLRHVQHLRPFQISRRLVRNHEYQAFMDDGGYDRFAFWHAEGWDWVQQTDARAPLYWLPDPEHPGQWWHQTLQGPRPVDPQGPVTHLNHHEAAAYASWANARLPTEFEWEAAAPGLSWGRRWEWTDSAYRPYPGFRPAPGAVGEYNGKFMLNQMVLRGASFATPPGHARLSYRNFFHAPARWQYSGLRLVRD